MTNQPTPDTTGHAIADDLKRIVADAITDAVGRLCFVLSIDVVRIDVNPNTHAFTVFVQQDETEHYWEVPAHPVLPPERNN